MFKYVITTREEIAENEYEYLNIGIYADSLNDAKEYANNNYSNVYCVS